MSRPASRVARSSQVPAIATGARVEIRDEEWVVRSVRHAHSDVFAVYVTGLSELVRNKNAIFLSDLDKITELKPEETVLTNDSSPGYRDSRLYLEALLRSSPPAGTDNSIYVGHRAAIKPVQYQLEPTAKALAQPRVRILLADGVGLGKTIEVGVLLSELIRRGKGTRILVVALKSILEQFQLELWARFTIPLVRLDSVGIQRVQSKIPSNMNPFYHYDRAIISIDTLKKDAKYRKYLEQCHWDVVVIDECQNVADRSQTSAGRKTLRWQLARLLSRTCDSLILTSATPHDGRPESFASLMNLLEPTAVADEQDYTHEEVADFFIRRFKKDIRHQVPDEFPDRVQDIEKIQASPEEDPIFNLLKEVEFRTIARERKNSGVLFRTTLLKAFLSSPVACLATVEKRLEHPDLKDQEDEAVCHDRQALEELRQLLRQVKSGQFTKYQKLLARLRGFGLAEKGCKERVVIFSERLDSLAFLGDNLKRDLGLEAEQIETFHGTLDDQSQKKLIKKFGTEASPIRILLASDAASEGVNLHFFCHRLIHFDLPWSLITLEQRNGRIDRFGQKFQPEIYYLLTIPGNERIAGDLRVLERLIEKEEHAHKNLGDVAWLLGLHEADQEEERIAKGIEERKTAEEVIPDEPAYTDFTEILFGDDQPDTPQVDMREPVSIYESELGYATDALNSSLAGSDGSVEYHEHLDGFTLYPPSDLKRRFDYLPQELTREAEAFKLTSDRALVMRSLDEAREEEERWPEWQLFWEQSPVAEWLNDRVLGAFTRHSAPVVLIGQGLDSDDSVFLFQGVISNRRGQPSIVEWFGVRFDGAEPKSVVTLEELVRLVGLDRPIPNPNYGLSDAELVQYSVLLSAAVTEAQAWMKRRRLARAEQIAAPLRDGLRKLKRWHDRYQNKLDKQQSLLPEMAGAARTVREKRLASESEEVEKLYKSRHQWIEEAIRTHETPYLRVVAVFASRGSS